MSDHIPTIEQVTEIVQAARNLTRTAIETFSVSDQADPPDFPTHERWGMISAIQRIERALNPSRIRFGGEHRLAIGVSGWPEPVRLARALRLLRSLLDGIIVGWGLELLCEAQGFVIQTDGAVHSGQYPDGTAVITVGKDWPPKIDRSLVDGIIVAISSITEIAGSAKSPKIMRSDDLPQARHAPDFRSVHWFGADYDLTAMQSDIVAQLWEAWEQGTPSVSAACLLAKTECGSRRLVDIFRNSPAWGSLIIDGPRRGTKQLAEP